MTDWSTTSTPSFEQTLQKFFFVCCTSFSGFKTAENTKVLATLCIMYVILLHSGLKMGEKVQYKYMYGIAGNVRETGNKIASTALAPLVLLSSKKSQEF